MNESTEATVTWNIMKVNIVLNIMILRVIGTFILSHHHNSSSMERMQKDFSGILLKK